MVHTPVGAPWWLRVVHPEDIELHQRTLDQAVRESPFVIATGGFRPQEVREAVGWVGNIIKTFLPVVKRFLGITPQPAVQVIRRARIPPKLPLKRLPERRSVRIKRISRGVAAGAIAGAGVAVVGSLVGGNISDFGGDAGGGGMTPTGVGGNGRTFRQTLVLTVDSETGEILSQETRRGAPYLMGRDVQIANRVFRQSTRLQKRLPKKLVKQTRRSALTEQVVIGALERAACPPNPKVC